MHKTARVKKISEKILERATKPLEKLGIFFENKEDFFKRKIHLLKNYLTDPEVDLKILSPVRHFLKILKLKTKSQKKILAKFECSRLGIIYSPCRDKGCVFWGNFPQQLNCASKYMKDQGRNTLSVAEMGIFSSYSRSHIHGILQSAMFKLRRSALKTIGAELTGIERIEEPIVDGQCCLCGEVTDNPNGFFSTPNDIEKYIYCSFNCWAKKPPSVVFIERNSGGKIEDLLSHLPRRYNSLEEAAKCLTISEKKLEKIMWSMYPENSLLKDLNQSILAHRVRGKKFWDRQVEKWSQMGRES